MSDYENFGESETQRFDARPPTERAPRRGVDLFMLIAGLATLTASAYVLSDGPSWVGRVDPRWLIAGGALVIGLLLLFVSLRSGADRPNRRW